MAQGSLTLHSLAVWAPPALQPYLQTRPTRLGGLAAGLGAASNLRGLPAAGQARRRAGREAEASIVHVLRQGSMK